MIIIMFFAYSLIISCSLMHIFCCAIPLLATIVGLTTSLGFISNGFLEAPIFQLFELFESKILLISGVILLLAWILKFKAKDLDCCPTKENKFCNINSNINQISLKIATSLYIVNLITAIFAKI